MEIQKKTIDTLTSKRLKKQERKSYSKVTGCMAMIGFDRNAATNIITVYAFEDTHNHPLTEFNEENICSPNHHLSIFDQELIVKASTINIGATKAHKLRASLKGGYDNLPATKNDFKNFWRDYTNIVGPNDAQCVVDQLIIRRDNYQNFNFQYKLDDDVLNAMFWVDETGRENYNKFSDVISMDATYRTNRYNMIFVSFTAINNHDKTINVGAGLISDETIESYSWLLEAFLSSHKKKPTMILLDMDAALSCSIAKVFERCTHRLCMWHIMSKMPSKDATSFFEKCVESVIHDKEKLQELVNSLQQLSETCGKGVSTRSSSIPIKDVIENIIGVPISSDVKIKVPSEIKTKGSGKRSRIKSVAEKAIAKALKPKRKCKGCNQFVNHDIRNCPINPSNVLRPFKKHQVFVKESLLGF
ncbi:unnamed protein product [Lactuca saligna]|uniref:MULE transposase domain-containing protein n=1 Tax=Lactuca saligna TaxID=75948 RepID=A0AA36E532_LACSI|nr:unnamed protein product [Lactuca saligna]